MLRKILTLSVPNTHTHTHTFANRRKFFKVMDMFITSIAVMVSPVCAYVQTHQNIMYILNMYNFCISILKRKETKTQIAVLSFI